MRHEAALAGEAARQPFFSLPSAARAGGRRGGGAPPSAGKADARLADHADGGAGQATASVTSCETMDAASWQRAISASSKRCGASIWPLKACPCSGRMGQSPQADLADHLRIVNSFLADQGAKKACQVFLAGFCGPGGQSRRGKAAESGGAATQMAACGGLP